MVLLKGEATGNAIGADGTTAFAEALMVNKAVTTINLHGACRVVGARARHAAGPWAAWPWCCSWARGAAADNFVGSAGATAIARALRVNKTVRTVWVDGMCRCRTRGAWRVCAPGGLLVLLTGKRRQAT